MLRAVRHHLDRIREVLGLGVKLHDLRSLNICRRNPLTIRMRPDHSRSPTADMVALRGRAACAEMGPRSRCT